MRIGFLSSQMSFYGGEVYVRNLAFGLQARGHEVACAVRSASALRDRLSAAGIPVVTLPIVDWFEPRTVLRLRRWLRRRRIEILHSQNPRDYLIAAAATAGTGVINVGTRHLLRRISIPWAKRAFYRRFGAMIAVSSAVADVLVRDASLPADRVVTIHNGCDLEADLPRRDGLRRALGLDDDALVVGYVGRLSPDKGLETFLESAGRLVNGRWPGLKIFVVGDDPDRRYGERLRGVAAELGLDGAVHFFGYVEDAYRASADFDIQVVCSRAEPFGLVTLEGMAHGHPVVATAAGGSREIIRDGIDGFLVPPGDAGRLAGRLDQLLERPGLRRRVGLRARHRVETAFSLARCLDRTEAVYRQVLAGEAPRLDLRAGPRAGGSP